jgi:hypothetical protein
MRVYVLLMIIPYDHSDIIGVYEDEDLATEEGNRLVKENPYVDYEVHEHEVLDGCAVRVLIDNNINTKQRS